MTAPSFVSAGPSSYINASTSLLPSVPSSVVKDDFLITLVDAEEESGPRTLTAPNGWTLIGGFPIHNLASAHSPYIIPAIQNQGTWIFHRFADSNEPTTHSFVFNSNTTARAVIIAYRGVNLVSPIQNKAGFDYYGSGATNGLGSGNTSLSVGRQVNLISTATTTRATYTVVLNSPSVLERFNSGEQPSGLNLIVHDTHIRNGIFTGPLIANRQSPSGSTDAFLFTFATLVLAPK